MQKPPFEYKSIVHSAGGTESFCGIKDASVSSEDGQERHLYFLAEFPVENVFFHQVMDELFDALHEAVSEVKTSSLEDGLEQGLQAVNTQFTNFASDIDPNQLSTVRALIAVAEGNTIHLSPVGNVHAFYCTKQRVLDVLGDRPVEPEINPQSLFSQIISGEFIPGSSMVLCTDRMIELFSPERIKRTITEQSPEEAAETFSKLVTDEIEHPSIVATFIKPDVQTIDAVREEREKIEVKDQDSMSVLVSKEDHTKALLSPGFLNAVRRLQGTVTETSKGLFSKLSLKKHSSEEAETIPVHVDEDEPNDPEEPEDLAPQKDEEGVDALPLLKKMESEKTRGGRIKAIFTKTTESTKQAFSKVSKEARTSVKNGKKAGFRGTMIRAGARVVLFIANLSWPRRILLILSFLLVFIFAQSVLFEGQLSSNKEEIQAYETAIEQADVKINEAKAALLYENEEGARASFNEARTLLAEIPEDHKLYESDVVQRLAEISDQEKVLNKEEDVTPVSTTPLPDGVSGMHLAFKDGTVYGASTSSGQVFKLDTGAWTEITSTEASWKNFKETEGRLIGVLENGNIQELSDGALTAIDYDAPENANITDVTFFNGRLYLLDAGNKQIWKLENVDGRYSGSVAWITDETNSLGTPHSLYIDGSIYVLNKEGTLTKWFDGSLQRSFSTGSDTLAYTDFIATENDLYLLSASSNRIVVAKKEGGLTKQLVAPALSDSTSLSANTDATNLFASTGHGMETISQ